MLIDAPGLETGSEEDGDTEITLTEDNADEVLRLINSFNR